MIVAVDIAGAATPELRHPCRSPCPETRKRHEGESCPSGRDPPLPSTRALVAHCWPRLPCFPLLLCCLPLAACGAACAGCCGGRCRCDAACAGCCSSCCNGTAAAAAAAGAAAAAPIAAAAAAQAALATSARAACCALRAARCKPRAACCVQQAAFDELCHYRCCLLCAVAVGPSLRPAGPAGPAGRAHPSAAPPHKCELSASVPTRLRRWPVCTL